MASRGPPTHPSVPLRSTVMIPVVRSDDYTLADLQAALARKRAAEIASLRSRRAEILAELRRLDGEIESASAATAGAPASPTPAAARLPRGGPTAESAPDVGLPAEQRGRDAAPTVAARLASGPATHPVAATAVTPIAAAPTPPSRAARAAPSLQPTQESTGAATAPRTRRTASIGTRILQALAARYPTRASAVELLEVLRDGIPADRPDVALTQSLLALRGNGLVETSDGERFGLTPAGQQRAQGAAAASSGPQGAASPTTSVHL